MQEINKVYQGNSLELLTQLKVSPQLIIASPPDQAETDMTMLEYTEFLHHIYQRCSKVLAEGGVLVSVTTDRKHQGSIYLKHVEIINSIKNELNLFNYKIWAKSLKTNLYILTYCHMLFFCKGKKPMVKNMLSDFLPDVWHLTVDKVAGYKTKDTFPSELVRRLVLTFTNSQDLVLDPFCGTGKTLKIAKDHGRNYLGFELEPKYVVLSEKLIAS